MPDEYLRVRDIVNAIVKAGPAELAKARGFRKKNLNWWRRRGEMQQAFGIQLSVYNFYDEGHFFINVGVKSDAILALEGRAGTQLWNPVDMGSEALLAWRLESLVPAAPAEWDVDANTDVSLFGLKMKHHWEQLFQLLDAIDSPQSMLEKISLEVGSGLYLRAQLRYVLGDNRGALADLQSAEDFFADRAYPPAMEDLIERLHLDGLRAYL